MADLLSALNGTDLICAEIAAALRHAEPQIYPAIALVVIIAVLTFASRQGPDQL